MKKFLALLLFCLSLPMMAQQTVVITGADGTEQLRMPVWKLGDIKFLPFEKPQTRMGTAIDLGLKSQVQWSNINIGAEDSFGVGYLFGWGNYDYTNHSTDLKYFPATIAGTNIVSTTNDIAQAYWGGEWRMPTVKDFEELLTLKWEWEPENNAYRVSNPDDEEQFIYLPLTGFAFGEDTLQVDSAYYWTGDIAHNDSASYVRFAGVEEDNENGENNSPAKLLEAFRARRFAVRPVYGEYVLPVSIAAAEAEVSANTATVDVTLTGGGKNIKYGLLFGTNESLTVGDGQTDDISFTIDDLDELGNELNRTFNLTTLLGKELSYETTYYYQAYVEVGNDKQWEAEKHSFTTEGFSIVANEAQVLSNTASVSVTVTGSGKNVECVLLYSRNESLTGESETDSIIKYFNHLEDTYTVSFDLKTLLGNKLEYETTYYYRAYVMVGDYKKWEDVAVPHQFTTDADRRLVDLGLSVKWARWDVGANAEYEYGDAYAWGCTDLKTFVTNATQNNISGTQYDVAHTHADWGDEWRMPTKEEWEELFSLCQAEGSYVRTPSGNYIFGVKFTRLDAWRDGQQLDDYLFIPYCGFDQIHEYRGGTGFYWAATSVDGTNAYQVKLETGVGEILANGKKVTPRNVRAVYGERDMTQIIQDGNGGDNNGGNNNGGGNNGGGNEGGGNEGGGDDPGTVLPDLDEDTFGAVDLGLTSGTLWANMNMGATHTYETGNYYAWGETEPKEQYTTETYQYYVNNRYVASTYRELSGHQDCDPCTQIEGGNWVMPTREQYEELIAQCTWTWLPGEEKYNNMPGFLVTSKKYPSKSIFFPAANRKFKRQPAYGIGYYWTATYNGADDERTSAYAVIMDPNNSVPAAIGNERRYYGMPIRPVQNKK